jgi:hypothetical protein
MKAQAEGGNRRHPALQGTGEMDAKNSKIPPWTPNPPAYRDGAEDEPGRAQRSGRRRLMGKNGLQPVYPAEREVC